MEILLGETNPRLPIVRIDAYAAKELKLSLAEKNISLNYTENALAVIAKHSYSRKYGARNMRRYIQKEIEDRLAEQIIADYAHTCSVAKIDAHEDALTVACM